MSRNRFIRRKRVGMFQILLFLAFFITIGYAYLTQNLSIIGTSFINNPRWDIYFDNIVVNPDSVELSGTDTPATIDQNNRTSVSFNVTLDKPGDFYEFTVDVVNNGTMDAKISNVSFHVREGASACDCFESQATYEDGTAIRIDQVLEAQNTITYKVRVGYKKDIDVSDLPTEPQEFDVSFSVTYVQAEAMEYLYQSIHDNSKASSSQAISKLKGQIYNSPEELMATEDDSVFIRYTVVGDEIIKGEIVFYENNQYYTISIQSEDDYPNMLSYMNQISASFVSESLYEKRYTTNNHIITLGYQPASDGAYSIGIIGAYQKDTHYGCNCINQGSTICECGYYSFGVTDVYKDDVPTNGYVYNFQKSKESEANKTRVPELDNYSSSANTNSIVLLRHQINNQRVIGTEIGYVGDDGNYHYLRVSDETEFQSMVSYYTQLANGKKSRQSKGDPFEYNYEEPAGGQLVKPDAQHCSYILVNGTRVDIASPSAAEGYTYRVIYDTQNLYRKCSCTTQQKCICEEH